ncbi:MAG: hypothetical protein IPQ07_10725 [Myxococcales bacterium]|nr:hypothetical protein [Myxococcales bacterium]
MNRVLAGVVFVMACSGSSSNKPPARDVTSPAPRGSAATTPTDSRCNCAATCDCHGDDDPPRDAATRRAIQACIAAKVTCEPCGECLAP